jgi:tryptophan-rich sensory protein
MDFNSFLLIACVLICQAAGGISGIFTAFSRNPWYQTLRKPALQPPGGAMGLIWVGLYLLMGAALDLVLRMPSETRGWKIALVLFAVQLVLSVLWPLLLFKIKHPFIAFVDLLLMWIFLLGTMITFAYLSPACLFLLAPVWIWVSFEAYLAFSLVSLNDEPVATVHP